MRYANRQRLDAGEIPLFGSMYVSDVLLAFPGKVWSGERYPPVRPGDHRELPVGSRVELRPRLKYDRIFLNYRPTWASLNISEGRIIQLRADCPGPRSAPDSCAGIEYGTTLSSLTVMRAFCADCQVIESEDEERDAERDSSYDSVSQLPLRCFYCDQRFQYR